MYQISTEKPQQRSLTINSYETWCRDTLLKPTTTQDDGGVPQNPSDLQLIVHTYYIGMEVT